MSVIDASTVIRYLLQSGSVEAEERIFDPRERQGAPDLLNAEVLHTMRRLEFKRQIEPKRSAEAVAILSQLPIVRYPTSALLDRAWALRHNFTPYDAMYVVLAEALGTGLVTADSHLAAAVQAHTAIDVVVVMA